jgi:hypothetical protein
MKAKQIFFAIVLLFLIITFHSIALAEVVYNNTSTVSGVIMTGEIGDTVNLAGTGRFINKFYAGIKVWPEDYGKTDDFRLRFYLPNAPGDYPGRLIWQSPPLTYTTLSQNVQLVAFDVLGIRVPDTFIWCVEHSNSSVSNFAFAYPPAIGSSPTYAWTNMNKFTTSPPNDFMAIIEATNRPDSFLLGTKHDSGYSGIGTSYRYSMSCRMFAQSLNDIKGPIFAGLTGWSAGTFPSLSAEDYAEFVEVLTNGQNDTIYVFGGTGGTSGTEQSLFTKSPGIAAAYPDFYGCHITDITMAVNNIVIDHSSPGWTYFTWDVTWEIWGHQMTADFNRNGIINFKDFAILANDWSKTSSIADISGPGGVPDNMVNSYDLAAFCDYWLKDITEPSTW